MMNNECKTEDSKFRRIPGGRHEHQRRKTCRATPACAAAIDARRGRRIGGRHLVSAPSRAWAQGGFDWKRFKGEKIEIALQKSPFHDVLQKYEPEFTALTGIEVGSEQIPEQQYRQKLAIEFASGKPSFDACYVAQATQKRLFGKGKWLADLRPLIADASLTAPDLDFADFSKASIEAGTQADGRIDTLPMTFHYNILMYNKELFQKKGIAVPTIIRGAHGSRRQAQRSGQRRQRLRCARAQERQHARSGRASCSAMASIRSARTAGSIPTDRRRSPPPRSIRSWCATMRPAGVAGFNWYECQGLYMQGKAAMWIDTSSVGAVTADPAKSRMAEQRRLRRHDAGTEGAPRAGIRERRRHRRRQQEVGPAWYWVQWATGKAMQARQVAGGYGASGRSSPFEAAKKSTEAKLNAEWLDAVLQSTAIAYPVLPDIVAGSEFRDVYGIALTNMLAPGTDPAAELKKATEAFKPILEKTEKA